MTKKRVQDFSYGIVPIYRLDQELFVLVLQQRHGKHWCFPKGHPEMDESPEETAIRELKEETDLSVTNLIQPGTMVEEKYSFFQRKDHIIVDKTVRYFLGEVTSQEVEIEKDEIAAYQWVKLLDAHKKMTFQEGKDVCTAVIDILREHHDFQSINLTLS